MFIQKRVVALGSAILCMALASQANFLQNGSFENGNFVPNAQDTMTLNVGATDMTGWEVDDASLAWIGPTNPFGLSASDGNYFLDLTGYHDNAPYAGVEQTFTTTIGATYELSLDVGTDPVYDNQAVSILVNLTGVPSTTFTSTPLAPNQWETFTYDFTATSATTTLSLIGQVANNAPEKYIGLDNVSIITIPEPDTLALFAGSGLLALFGWRRFRKA